MKLGRKQLQRRCQHQSPTCWYLVTTFLLKENRKLNLPGFPRYWRISSCKLDICRLSLLTTFFSFQQLNLPSSRVAVSEQFQSSFREVLEKFQSSFREVSEQFQGMNCSFTGPHRVYNVFKSLKAFLIDNGNRCRAVLST